jgi:hypothetical protein
MRAWSVRSAVSTCIPGAIDKGAASICPVPGALELLREQNIPMPVESRKLLLDMVETWDALTKTSSLFSVDANAWLV